MNNLIQLQRLARCNNISIFKVRKDRKGYTKTHLTIPQLKSRLTRNGVSYKIKKMNFGMDSEPTFADLAADAEARWDVHEAPEEARARRRVENSRAYAKIAANAAKMRRRAEWIARRIRRQMGPASSLESARKREAKRAERAERAERADAADAAESRARAMLEIAAREWERDLDEDARKTRFGLRYKRKVTNNFGMRSYAQVAREANETERLGAPVRVLLDRVLARIEAPAQVTNQADLLEAYRLIRMFPQASLESTRAQRALDRAQTRSRDAWWEQVERREDDEIDRITVQARKRVESSGLPNNFNLMVLIYNKLESASSLFLENLASINPPGAQRKLQVEIMKYAKILRNLLYDISEQLAFNAVVVNRREENPEETFFTNEEVKKVRDERSRFNNTIDIVIDELRLIPPNAFGLLGTQNVNVSEASNVDSFIINYSNIIRHYSLRIKDYVDDGLQEYSLERIRDLLENLLRRIFATAIGDNTRLVNQLFNLVG